jgi:hypothetical protein
MIRPGLPSLLFLLASRLALAQPAPSDEVLRKALESDQAARAASASPPAPAAPPDLAAQAAVRPPGTGLLNPNISAIVDSAFGYYGRHLADFAAVGIPESGDDPSAARDGFTVQEVELAFQAPIDPYLEGSVFLTIPNLEGIEVEEAFLVTTALPANLQIKAGTFRSQLGRNNGQHLHLQHFTRRPLMTPLLFGVDGLRPPGIQASVLLPRVPWYATFYVEAFSVRAPDSGVATFGGGGRGPSQLTYSAVLEQFWPVSDASSLLLGLNLATGIASECPMPPCGTGRRSTLYGADLYYKWRPPDVQGELGSLTWATEYFARSIASGGQTEGAFYTEPVVQLAKRWFIGARLDVTGIPSGAAVPRRYGLAGSITFAPTEFSRLRAYAQDLSGPGISSVLVGFLQAEFSMGAHGAHPF